MTRDDVRSIAAGVYADLLATGAEELYDALLAERPRPGASVDDEWRFAGPMLEEDES